MLRSVRERLADDETTAVPPTADGRVVDAAPEGTGPALLGVLDPRVAEERLIVARARVDPSAFAPLYARYLDPVFRYCALRLRDRAAAEDATGQVFARALAALPACRADRDEGGSFAGWLFAIARRVVADDYREGARRPTAPLEAAGSLPDRHPSPEELALAADERRSVAAPLRRLPPDQARVVELRLAGLRGTEVAAVLDRSPAAVKMLQARAVDRLRALLAESSAASGPPHHPADPSQGVRPPGRAHRADSKESGDADRYAAGQRRPGLGAG